MNMNSKGFTLVETVTATGLSTMILICLMTLLISSIYGWSKGVSRNTAMETATMASQRLSNDMRDGMSASVYSGVLTVLFPGTVTDSSNGETVYDLASSATTSRSYLVTNKVLVRRENGSDTVIARNITSASFSIQGQSVVTSIQSLDNSGSYSSSALVNGKVLLRNYR